MRESFWWCGVPNASSSEEGDTMKKRIRRFFALAPFLAVAAGIMLAPTVALGDPVEYLRICDIVPQPGYFYLPGTDICVNTSTNSAVQNTNGGIWEWRSPDSQRASVAAYQPECQGGELVKVADITSSGLTLNAYSRLETAHYPLNLRPGQYIASVIYTGGFNFSSSIITIENLHQSFCMFYYSSDGGYVPFGCLDSSSPATANGTWAFASDLPIPAPDVDQIYLVGAFGQLSESTPSVITIQGKLSVSMCVMNMPGGRGFASQRP